MEKSRIKSKKNLKNQTEKKKGLQRLYEKKPLIEFIVTLLSVPSLILVLILNYNSIKNIDGAKPTPTPTPTPAPASSVSGNGTSGSNTANPNFFTEPVTRTPRPTMLPSQSQIPCNTNLGPVNIASPTEGAIVSNNPVEVDISYDDSTYCSAVWSYSVNGSNWSSYDNNSVALYNLPDGPIIFQLRVKSLTSSDTTTLTRNFSYNGQSTGGSSNNASGSAQ